MAPALAPPFSAVVTTGIYCRPGCSGTPRDENVRPFAYAAAAEAHGFRPCLRCRPDTSPGPSSWLAPSELVCRALRLIGQGALDGAGEHELALRLGVSERHLRRLFDTHVGASPDAVARSRRVHFVRRLLIETDLPIAQIGFASGFGSVRQFNRAVKEVFRLAPTELRRRRRRADRLMATAGLDLRLPYRPPFDWGGMAGFLAARATAGVEAVDSESYRRTIVVDGEPGAIELRPLPGSAHLLLRVHSQRVDGLIHVVDQARRIFDVDADPRDMRATLRRDPALRPLVDARPGLRVAGAWDGFELGVRAILGQQVTVRTASTLTARVATLLGVPVGGFEHLGLSRLFPAAEVLAGADPAGLATAGVTPARAATVRRFAEAVASGDLVLDASQGLPSLIERLCALPGVGPWTAHYIAMRAAGERDAFPSGDLGLRRGLGDGTRLATAELQSRAERWRPWRAYAAMHLWVGGR